MKYLDKDIVILKLENEIIRLLKQNHISLIKDLWILNKDDLKKIGFDANEIKKIVVKLQLLGIDLNRKKY